jgi:hypothetical protein
MMEQKVFKIRNTFDPERNRSWIFLLFVLFTFAEIIIDPLGNFPLNDDWWYAQTLRILNTQGFLDPTTWGTSTMLSQLFFAKIFTGLFGFSFTVLRFSTLFLSFTGIISFYFLIEEFCLKNKPRAFLITLLLLYNPLYLSLSNSFMTDVPFTSFIFSGMLFYFKHKSSLQKKHLFLSFIFLILALFTRQLGLAFIAGILVSEYLNKKTWKTAWTFFFIFSMVLLFLFEYWMYRKHVFNHYSYVFFEGDWKTNDLQNMVTGFAKRWVHYITLSGLFLLPLIFPFLLKVFREKEYKSQKKVLAITLALLIPVLWSMRHFPIGNYLYNLGVGPETLYDVYIGGVNASHATSGFIFAFIKILAALGSFGVLLMLTDLIHKVAVSFRNKYQPDHFLFTVCICLFLYYALLSVNNAFFDRYTILFSAFLVPLFLISAGKIQLKSIGTRILIFLMAVFSIFTTADYMNGNRTRWAAVDYLHRKGVSNSSINAGYEHAGLYFGETKTWYARWLNDPPQEYVIAYGNIKGYRTESWFVYRRYIPLKKDSIFVLRKTE